MTNNLDKVYKQLRYLTGYAYISSISLIIAFFLILKMDRKIENFKVEELTAKRINIIESNGQPRLVLSNMEKSPERLYYGKPYGIPGGNRPGIIFYDDNATECGGLIFEEVKTAVENILLPVIFPLTNTIKTKCFICNTWMIMEKKKLVYMWTIGTIVRIFPNGGGN
jgi:hypothetical protein